MSRDLSFASSITTRGRTISEAPVTNNSYEPSAQQRNNGLEHTSWPHLTYVHKQKFKQKKLQAYEVEKWSEDQHWTAAKTRIGGNITCFPQINFSSIKLVKDFFKSSLQVTLKSFYNMHIKHGVSLCCLNQYTV